MSNDRKEDPYWHIKRSKRFCRDKQIEKYQKELDLLLSTTKYPGKNVQQEIDDRIDFLKSEIININKKYEKILKDIEEVHTEHT